MVYRIAAVSFLNTLPLIDGLVASADPRVAVTRDLPSRLGGELAAGRADVALLPVVEILRGASGGVLEPANGIACLGNVDSVRLFARGEPPALARIRADRGSRTSVALLRVLLAERWGVRPEFVVEEPQPGRLPEPGEGVLVIGDRCFAYERAFRTVAPDDGCIIDLGGAWRELTGLPFVFAAWAVAPGFAERAGSEACRELAGILDAARADGVARLREIARREAAAGRLGPGGEATVEAMVYYYERSLHFRIDADDLAGVERFRDLCLRHGVLPAGTAPLNIVR